MTTKQTLLTNDQKLFIAEIQSTYGIDPNEVIYFSDDSEPFFGYEATCILCNHLTDLRDIEPELVASPFADSLSIKCRLTLSDGRTRSGLGVVNVNETIDNVRMSEQQLYATASARAIRNALRTAGINLLKLHDARKRGDVRAAVEYSGPPQDERTRLLREVHAYGQEVGLILGSNKEFWYQTINKRYGTNGADGLALEELVDFAAYLRSLLPAKKAAA